MPPRRARDAADGPAARGASKAQRNELEYPRPFFHRALSRSEVQEDMALILSSVKREHRTPSRYGAGPSPTAGGGGGGGGSMGSGSSNGGPHPGQRQDNHQHAGGGLGPYPAVGGGGGGGGAPQSAYLQQQQQQQQQHEQHGTHLQASNRPSRSPRPASATDPHTRTAAQQEEAAEDEQHEQRPLKRRGAGNGSAPHQPQQPQQQQQVPLMHMGPAMMQGGAPVQFVWAPMMPPHQSHQYAVRPGAPLPGGVVMMRQGNPALGAGHQVMFAGVPHTFAVGSS